MTDMMIIAKDDYDRLLAAYQDAATIVWDIDNSNLTEVIAELDQNVDGIHERVKYLNEGIVEFNKKVTA